MQKRKSKEFNSETECDSPVDVFIQSQDLEDGSKTSIISVETKKLLKKQKKLEIDTDRISENNIYASDVDTQKVGSGEEYVSEDELRKSLQSEYHDMDIIINRRRRRTSSVSLQSLKEKSEVLVFDTELEDGRLRFYKCEVLNKVSVKITDPWKESRKLTSTFHNHRDAKKFAEDIRSLKEKDPTLRRNSNYLSIEGEPKNMEKKVQDNLMFGSVSKSFLMGVFVGLTVGLMGYGIPATLLSLSAIIIADYSRAIWKSKKKNTRRFNLYGFDPEEMSHSFDLSDVQKMEIKEEIKDKIEIRIEDDIRLISNEADAEWILETIKNSDMPSKESSKFIDRLGIERICEDSFKAKIQNRMDEPDDYCLQSECGNWYIYPELEYE